MWHSFCDLSPFPNCEFLLSFEFIYPHVDGLFLSARRVAILGHDMNPVGSDLLVSGHELCSIRILPSCKHSNTRPTGQMVTRLFCGRVSLLVSV